MKALLKKNGFTKAWGYLLLTRFSVLFCLFVLFYSCKKHDHQPPPAGSIDLKQIADNRVAPITVAEPPDNSKRLFVVDEIGKIWII